jgi:hypothetical protein
MVEAPPIKHVPDGSSQISWNPSELQTSYERLLRLYIDQLQKDEFNPYQPIPLIFLKSFSPFFLMLSWKRAVLFFKVPNTLRQDLVGETIVLRELERLNDQTLRGVAECNRINYRRLLQRSVFGWLPKLTGIVVLLLSVAKTIKESVGMDIFAAVPSAVWHYLVLFAVGLLLGSILNLVILLPRVLLVRALDDLIAIAVALRGTPKPER